ncbi:MAG: phosphotransferase [Pseudonocardiaceae bacterium]
MAGHPLSTTEHAQAFELREQLGEDVLHRVERSMGARLDRATLVYGTQGMTAGFRTDAGTWVRVQWRRPWKIYGPAWAGPECASVLRGVAKPDWFQTASWYDDAREVVWRADEMGLVSSPIINSTGVIATEPELPESWWGSLRNSLAALAEHDTDRVGVRQEHLTLRINQVFPGEVDTTVDEWVTAHADLHWGNLTAPDCYLLDWEDWGAAPRGLDAAVLWGFSLRVPTLAARVQREFQTDLQTRSGKLAQLLFCSNVIRVNAKRADPSPLVQPAKLAAETLLAELRA